MTTVIDVLEEGRDFLQTHKWGRREYYNEDTGAYCAVGALYAGIFGEDYWKVGRSKDDDLDENIYDTVNLANKYLSMVSERGVTGFNDRIAKRKRDIISLYNRAIKLAKEKNK